MDNNCVIVKKSVNIQDNVELESDDILLNNNTKEKLVVPNEEKKNADCQLNNHSKENYELPNEKNDINKELNDDSKELNNDTKELNNDLKDNKSKLNDDEWKDDLSEENKGIKKNEWDDVLIYDDSLIQIEMEKNRIIPIKNLDDSEHKIILKKKILNHQLKIIKLICSKLFFSEKYVEVLSSDDKQDVMMLIRMLTNELNKFPEKYTDFMYTFFLKIGIYILNDIIRYCENGLFDTTINNSGSDNSFVTQLDCKLNNASSSSSSSLSSSSSSSSSSNNSALSTLHKNYVDIKSKNMSNKKLNTDGDIKIKKIYREVKHVVIKQFNDVKLFDKNNNIMDNLSEHVRKIFNDDNIEKRVCKFCFKIIERVTFLMLEFNDIISSAKLTDNTFKILEYKVESFNQNNDEDFKIAQKLQEKMYENNSDIKCTGVLSNDEKFKNAQQLQWNVDCKNNQDHENKVPLEQKLCNKYIGNMQNEIFNDDKDKNEIKRVDVLLSKKFLTINYDGSVQEYFEELFPKNENIVDIIGKITKKIQINIHNLFIRALEKNHVLNNYCNSINRENNNIIKWLANNVENIYKDEMQEKYNVTHVYTTLMRIVLYNTYVQMCSDIRECIKEQNDFQL